MRSAANTLWVKGVEAGGEVPDLVFPYFESAEDLTERARLLDAKLAELKAANGG